MIHESLEDGALDPAINAMWTAFTVIVSQIDIYSPTTVIVLLTVGDSNYTPLDTISHHNTHCSTHYSLKDTF